MMTARHCERGFSLVELLVSTVVLLVVMTTLFAMLVHNSKVNKSRKLAMDVQANARSTLSVVVQKLRSAGWDPMNPGTIPLLALDPDLTDDVSQIEIYADVDKDGTTDGTKEQILIRHQNGRVEWRSTNDVSAPFTIMAASISNDADGDGTIEPMFVPDSYGDPTRVTVQVTAQSPMPDPLTGEVIRYTVSSDVVLRKRLE
jgi:prepilin-type N-terminal cleavage/methylation domain-containing protein